jgi:hypothetical protein
MGAIGGSFSSLEPNENYGVVVRVVSSKFVVSFFEFIIASFGYGGELSSSILLPIILLVDTKRFNFLL